MKRISFLLILLLAGFSPLFASLSDAQMRETQEVFRNLSLQDLQDVIVYLDSSTHLSFNSQKSEIRAIAIGVLNLKVNEFFVAPARGESDKMASADAREYRTLQIAQMLESIVDREVFLNQDEAFVLSNGTPLVYQEQTGTFHLRPYQTPAVDPDLHKGGILEVFNESLKHPNYSLLRWNAGTKEYTLYSVEYDKIFRESDLSQLSDDQVIVLFGKLFPVSLQKPAWAWKIFGLTSVKREIKNLFERENASHLN